MLDIHTPLLCLVLKSIYNQSCKIKPKDEEIKLNQEHHIPNKEWKYKK